ncbi:helix-turn-helix transcriptional regulator [Acuticoccus mangrovi]|uniref:Helix-turn-helix domain-containing protein n=1 Tax=Acuticoccus mangrovi TaxID=2796142 RepID=A0A934IJ19_9HYPH|nr:helix-turn-helix transcriptional regulator [Acuticoccus mangrovi]MBJ3777378.1 helix-turn-helix domain-containing protein [Acuticoccus mangrovi]
MAAPSNVPSNASSDSASLGAYLRDRRLRLDPMALGFPAARRRTPGLRREEVAQRANISATWYTWLEQGRGGAPSADVLDRIARALMLTEVEREHVFILGLGRVPEIRHQSPAGITPRLQRVLDTLDACPAIVKTATWDILAWNRAAAAVLTDYDALPPKERNVLRLMFTSPQVRAANPDWESVARFVVAVFRADSARAGAVSAMEALAEELCRESPEFAAMWREHDVRGFGEGVKRLRHPVLGELALEYSAFAVDGRADLAMLVYNPLHAEDRDRIRTLAAKMTPSSPPVAAGDTTATDER